MPLLPNNANIFGDLMRRPDIAANWFQGAVSPNAYGPGVGGGGSFSPDEQTFLLGTAATGQPVQSIPREGLFPQLLSKIGLISPDMHPDVRTQFAEQLLLKQMKEQEAERRAGLIDHAYNIVKEVGGDKFAQMGPSLFRGIIDDPTIFEAFKGVPSYAQTLDQKLQEQLQATLSREYNQQQLQEMRSEQQLQAVQLRDTDAMARLEESLGTREEQIGGTQTDKDLALLNKVFFGMLPDQAGFDRAIANYVQTRNPMEAIQAGKLQSTAPADPGFWGGLRDLFSTPTKPAGDPAKKKAAAQALGIGG